MSLVNRVSAFFLVALAVILIGNAALFYTLVRNQQLEQFEQQLYGALHTLVAAVEVEPDDVKWELSDHTIGLGIEDGVEDVRWAVYDEQGAIIDHSPNISAADAAEAQLLEIARFERPPSELNGGHWRILQQRLAAVDPKPVEQRDPLERAAVVVTVGRSPANLNATLQSLGLLVCILPIVLWIIAAAAGRRYCVKALSPLLVMANDARAMTDGDAVWRLPVPDSRDELSQLGQAFNELLDKLYQALHRQQRFTGDAAHQLRTPLTVLLGQIDVALRRPRSSEEYASTLGILRDHAANLQQIVEALLFLARVEGEATPPDSQAISFQDWLPDHLSRWQANPRWQDIQLEISGDPRPIASPQLLAQLLDNLIGNALKYSQPGTLIKIEASTEAATVVISVTDRGQGIPPEDQDGIFQPFFRTAVARQSGIAGTGLGLAIAMQIAAVNHGTLTCESQLGQGSRFTLRLPAEITAAKMDEELSGRSAAMA